jgi:hypothetical protein
MFTESPHLQRGGDDDPEPSSSHLHDNRYSCFGREDGVVIILLPRLNSWLVAKLLMTGLMLAAGEC